MDSKEEPRDNGWILAKYRASFLMIFPEREKSSGESEHWRAYKESEIKKAFLMLRISLSKLKSLKESWEIIPIIPNKLWLGGWES